MIDTKACSLLVLAALLCAAPAAAQDDAATAPRPSRTAAAERGPWLSWRGPHQNGTSDETGLPDALVAAEAAWTYDIAGRGTPVIDGERLYGMGYRGAGKDLEEVLFCLEVETGGPIWERAFKDFLSDVIYTRYAIGSPTVDPATGNVFCLTTAGLLNCFTADGRQVWQRSLMSEFGRLTFPNGRTGAPLIDGDLCIVHVITSSWGPYGPARDRFYAFDTTTGENVWTSTPGGPPKDSSFSFPVVADDGGRRVLYAGLGGGHLAAVDVRTGQPLWRFQMAVGGVNSSALLHGDDIIAIHGKENLDASVIGRMVSLPRAPWAGVGEDALVRATTDENWRAELCAFTSSPVLVGDRVYQTVLTGDLVCVDANDGRVRWAEKLASSQIHASPVAADGKLYVPMENGSLHVVRPGDDSCEVLHSEQLDGSCLGAPAIADGRIFVHTTERLYCFGPPPSGEVRARPEIVQLQVVPADVTLRQGEVVAMRVRGLDATGRVVTESVDGLVVTGLPLGVTATRDGRLVVARDAVPSTRIVRVQADGLGATARLRVVPVVPFAHDFEDAELKPHPSEEGVLWAPPPAWWLSAFKKWEVRELDGDKVLARTLDNPLFQRTMSLAGHPDMADYTVTVDIRTDGNRRSMSSGGVVNQRYLIVLKGNHQELEISSNMELVKESVRYRWKPGVWYRLKTRVDIGADGRGVVRAKVWPRDEEEPAAWTLEVEHADAHTHGAPGVYGFTPQSRFRVYLDNLTVTPND